MKFVKKWGLTIAAAAVFLAAITLIIITGVNTLNGRYGA